MLGGAFSPLSLAPVLWLDPSDLSTLKQERTGASATTPSVVDGVVGTMLDRSGNGNHVVAPADAARPILRNSSTLYWLEFDGVDDALAVTFTLNQPWERLSGIQQIAHAANQRVFGPAVGNDAGFLFQTNASPEMSLFDGSTACSNSDAAVGADAVVIERHNGATSRLGVDSNSYATGDVGTNNNDGVTVGSDAAGGNDGNIRFHGSVVVNRLLTDPEITLLRTYLAAKQGRVL